MIDERIARRSDRPFARNVPAQQNFVQGKNGDRGLGRREVGAAVASIQPGCKFARQVQIAGGFGLPSSISLRN